jgi:hypothetical protein
VPNVGFTTRLRRAVEALAPDPRLSPIATVGGSLYSPVYRSGKYTWAKVMDSDGLFVSRRAIHDDQGAATKGRSFLLLGVIIQSEDSTSQTKPNPIGKASLGHISNGIWINTTEGRLRLDRIQVVFVLPKGASVRRRAKFETAKRNVQNAADMMPDAITLEVDRGISQAALGERILGEVRPFLVGRGRPRGS